MARWAALAVSLLLSFWVLWHGRRDLAQLESLAPAPVAALIGLQMLLLAAQSERLRVILGAHSRRVVPPLEWGRMFVVGRLLNAAVMQSGNAYRLMTLKRTYGVGYSRYVSSLAAQTWVSVLFSLLVASVLVFTVESNRSFPANLGASLVLATLAIAVAPYVARMLGRRYLPGRPGRIWTALEGVFSRVVETVRDPSLSLALLALTIVAFALGVTVIVQAFSMAGLTMPLAAAATILALMQITNVVMLTPGNLGIQELGYAGLMSLFGFPAASGIVASALVRISAAAALALGSLVLTLLVRHTSAQEPDRSREA